MIEVAFELDVILVDEIECWVGVKCRVGELNEFHAISRLEVKVE